MTNKEAKLRLIRWILFLIEFNVDLKDKGGTENHVADHLSHLVHVEGEIYLQETSPHKQLFFTSVILPWYANIVNYLVTNMLPPYMSKAQRDKVKSDVKYFIWDDVYLWKHCADQVIIRYISKNEIISILTFCYSYTCEGHFRANRAMRKVLEYGLYQGCQFRFGRCFVFSIGMECFSFGVFWRAISGLYSSYIYIYIFNKHNSNSR